MYLNSLLNTSKDQDTFNLRIIVNWCIFWTNNLHQLQTIYHYNKWVYIFSKHYASIAESLLQSVQ